MLDLVVNYLLNFTFIFSSMILFSAPFVGWFYLQHSAKIREKKPHFNQFMELFFQSKVSNWLVFFWALSEAIFWFIIPEFLLLLLIFMRIRRKRELLMYDIGGTIIGTILGLSLSLSTATILHMPYIFPGMIHAVNHWYDTMGVWGLLQQPFSGVPYKVFLSQFQFTNISVIAFFFLALVVRVGRYAIAYYLLSALYAPFHKLVRKHYAILLVVGIAIFTFMLLRVANLYRF